MSATPLNELLSRTLVGITRAYEAVEPTAASLAMLLLAENEAPISKRALITVRKRYERAGSSPADRARGYAALEQAEKKFRSLRAPLVALVDRFELELPHYWITYGTADPTVTGGRYRPGSAGPPRIPPHGADWAPVLRVGKTAKDLPVTALLSQALCNFAIDYSSVAGALGWTVLGLLPIDPKKGTPMAEVGRCADLSGTGKSGLERHGVVKIGPKPQQIAKLTWIGKRLREAYEPATAAVEHRWREVYGDARVTKLRSALERLAPPGPKHPHLAWNPVVYEDSAG